jgi:hypothetical protein
MSNVVLNLLLKAEQQIILLSSTMERVMASVVGDRHLTIQ